MENFDEEFDKEVARVINEKAVAFDFMVNLEGLAAYVCQECGDVVEMDMVDVHAEALHGVRFISMLNIPIGSSERHEAQREES